MILLPWPPPHFLSINGAWKYDWMVKYWPVSCYLWVPVSNLQGHKKRRKNELTRFWFLIQLNMLELFLCQQTEVCCILSVCQFGVPLGVCDLGFVSNALSGDECVVFVLSTPTLTCVCWARLMFLQKIVQRAFSSRGFAQSPLLVLPSVTSPGFPPAVLLGTLECSRAFCSPALLPGQAHRFSAVGCLDMWVTAVPLVPGSFTLHWPPATY